MDVVDVVAVLVAGGDGDDFGDEVVVDVVVMGMVLLCKISQGCYSTGVSVLPINSYWNSYQIPKNIHHLLLR